MKIYLYFDKVSSCMKEKVRLSDHFTFKKLLRFTISPILMMLFTSIYWIVDGFFISNFAGSNEFAGVKLIFPVVMIVSLSCVFVNRNKYGYSLINPWRTPGNN